MLSFRVCYEVWEATVEEEEENWFSKEIFKLLPFDLTKKFRPTFNAQFRVFSKRALY
jgi:hypothetical protein